MDLTQYQPGLQPNLADTRLSEFLCILLACIPVQDRQADQAERKTTICIMVKHCIFSQDLRS